MRRRLPTPKGEHTETQPSPNISSAHQNGGNARSRVTHSIAAVNAVARWRVDHPARLSGVPVTLLLFAELGGGPGRGAISRRRGRVCDASCYTTISRKPGRLISSTERTL
jgi:hypothetical protein